jgi:AraC-like DNA-binding protein
MHSGDVIVLPRGGPQRMASDPTVWPAQRHVELPASERLPFEITIGGDGPVVATFVCGFLGCDRRPFNPLLDALPPVVVVRGGQGSWLSTFGQQALLEADMKRSGGELMVTRLAELMFIEVVRRYVETLPPEEPGWLAGMRDGVVGKALALLHTSPAHAWTLDSLARAVSCSRTVLAERFSEMVKEPPMRYLTRWRMQLAAGRLSGSTVKLSEIAGDLGYDSEEAFSRAFKRVVGASPGEWRSSREFPRTREVLKKENAPRDGSSSRTRGQRKFARERDG